MSGKRNEAHSAAMAAALLLEMYPLYETFNLKRGHLQVLTEAAAKWANYSAHKVKQDRRRRARLRAQRSRG